MYLTFKNTTRAYATHFNNNSFILGSTPTKKTLTKCKMQRFYNTTHPQHEAIKSAMSELINGHQGLSRACLQNYPEVYFQQQWLFILRPHCTQMSDTLLSNFIFCRCN